MGGAEKRWEEGQEEGGGRESAAKVLTQQSREKFAQWALREGSGRSVTPPGQPGGKGGLEMFLQISKA